MSSAKEQFKERVDKLLVDWKVSRELSLKQLPPLDAEARQTEQFDPELARLQRAPGHAYINAVNDLIAYIELKTECKNT